jgi:hypothetical protein
MKQVDGQTFLTIGEVAKRIERIPQTIKNWIAWYGDQAEDVKRDFPLPIPITDLDRKGTRYFREEDLEIFEQFKEKLKYGTIAEFSCTRWGERGKNSRRRNITERSVSE